MPISSISIIHGNYIHSSLSKYKYGILSDPGILRQYQSEANDSPY